jgi:glycosyltransferase involved in cell wall biosynthesis
VSFTGALPRRRALGLLAAADASVLASDWENFPHGVVESLAMGTPVIATRTGGVAEIVRDGENGLLVEPGDAAGFRAAVRRYFADESLRAHLRANAAASVARFDRDAIFGRLESLLEEAAS